MFIDPQYRVPLKDEVEALCHIAHQAARHMPALTATMADWTRRARQRILIQGGDCFTAECELEQLTRDLRQICLRAAHETVEGHYRSPTLDEMSDPEIDLGCGYERTYAPVDLEARLAATGREEGFPLADHVVFSSGQAALAAAFVAGAQLQSNRSQPLEVLHIGGYFETGALLRSMMQAGFCRYRQERSLRGTPDLVVVEPVYHSADGQFHRGELMQIPPRTLPIIDATLSGPSFRLPERFPVLRRHPMHVVLRSGLKLDQAGLELANAGILSVFAHSQSKAEFDRFCRSLRHLRMLNGTSLSFAAGSALGFPWCLDIEQGARYAEQIFANNRLLATNLRGNGAFAQISHPALSGIGGEAPYVILRLPDDSHAAYRHFGNSLSGVLAEKNILMERGGSFGFRGHRFDIVLPDDDSPPFLRIAMGFREGWSRDRIVDLFHRMKPEYAGSVRGCG